MFMSLNSLKRAFQIGGQSIISQKIMCTRWAKWLQGSVLCVFLFPGSLEETRLFLLLKTVVQHRARRCQLFPRCVPHTTGTRRFAGYRWPLFCGVFSGICSWRGGLGFSSKSKWAFVCSFHILCILAHPHHRCSAPCVKTGFQLIRLQHLTLKGKQIKSLSWGYNASFSPLWLCIIFFCIWSHHQNLTSCICVC